MKSSRRLKANYYLHGKAKRLQGYRLKRIELAELVTNSLDYKAVQVLIKFLNDHGKILPRRLTGLTLKQQKQVAKLIKQSRIAALLAFVIPRRNPIKKRKGGFKPRTP